MPYPHLLAPIALRGLVLRNRVLLPALTTGFAEGGRVTDRLVDFHVARVRGGCGLVVTEPASVTPAPADHAGLDISDDDTVPGLGRFTAAVHAAGGAACVQLWDGGEAADIARAFGDAAARAVRAGFDAVEVSCLDVDVPAAVGAVRAAVPDAMPVLLRVHRRPGEVLDDLVGLCRRARAAGADVVEVAGGYVAGMPLGDAAPPIDVPRGFAVGDAAAVRAATGLVTVAVGRINHPEQAERILASGQADLVAVGRGQVADPQFVAKAAADRAEDVVRCIACNQGCYDRVSGAAPGPITCLRNPMVGREAEGEPVPVASPLRVLVVGGGIAGMEAAYVLAERGHKPVLCEESDHLGGQLAVAGVAPQMGEMADAAASRADQVVRAGVEVRLGTRVTPSLVDLLAPDAVVDATGARPIHPSIPGGDRPNVTDAVAVLTGRRTVTGSAVVVGGGLVGLEVAEHLAARGVRVTVVEMADAVGAGLGALRRACSVAALDAAGVEVVTGATVTAVTATGVLVERAGTQGEAEREVAGETVVMAVGARPDDHTALARHCAARGVGYHVVGDAVRARRALDAVAEANALARAL